MIACAYKVDIIYMSNMNKTENNNETGYNILTIAHYRQMRAEQQSVQKI